jgi:hypothetical protein
MEIVCPLSKMRAQKDSPQKQQLRHKIHTLTRRKTLVPIHTRAHKPRKKISWKINFLPIKAQKDFPFCNVGICR